jgi:hypothetical protein
MQVIPEKHYEVIGKYLCLYQRNVSKIYVSEQQKIFPFKFFAMRGVNLLNNTIMQLDQCGILEQYRPEICLVVLQCRPQISMLLIE